MKIAIIGTRGIPNNYGGFEAFAEKISVELVARGHEVIVFNSSLHPFKGDNYKGVKIVHCYDPENIVGTAGQFIYDFNCIRQCRSLDPDIILQLGYTSSTLWNSVLPKNSFVITNMDGLEWSRSKYSPLTKKYLKQAEKWAVNGSDYLIADNSAIADYLFREYQVKATFIPYSAEIWAAPDAKNLDSFNVSAGHYNLVIARLEPENNIEIIIKGHLAGRGHPRLLIVGGIGNKYAKQLYKKYASHQIVFTGAVYEPEKINMLRYYCHTYFHGHSVGGTNPSLLEAMAYSALICAHDNEFNRAVLNEDALYFRTEEEILLHLNKNYNKENFSSQTGRNLEKIKTIYNNARIAGAYESLFLQCMNEMK